MQKNTDIMLNDISSQRKIAETQQTIALTLTTLGLSSGEITFAKAKKIYGSWFVHAVESGALGPCRYGEHNRTWYSVPEIFALKAAELEKAELIIK